MSYYRYGERGMDSFYKPFMMVEYYRYVRFFPEGIPFRETEKATRDCSVYHGTSCVSVATDWKKLVSLGHMLMFTSPEDPYAALPRLRTRDSKSQGLLKGYYRMAGNQVKCNTGTFEKDPHILTISSFFQLLKWATLVCKFWQHTIQVAM